jgi:hypothetical protein
MRKIIENARRSGLGRPFQQASRMPPAALTMADVPAFGKFHSVEA